MNYRHVFHAGNFADVFKHVVLTRILIYLMRKPSPIRVIDTHAGIGWYDLAGEEAQRTGEWRQGIGRLLAADRRAADLPAAARELLQPYLDAAGEVFCDGQPGRYPGSPALSAALLRPLDRMIFCEMHPQDARLLGKRMGRDKRVKIIEIDGYTGLRAYVPPVERRGLVLIDPPFEKADEFSALVRSVADAWRKWPGGVYCIWYPVKAQQNADGLYAAFAEAGIRNVLRLELSIRRPEAGGPLASNGLAIINPPFVLEDEARQILPVLTEILTQGPGSGWRVEQAVDE